MPAVNLESAQCTVNFAIPAKSDDAEISEYIFTIPATGAWIKWSCKLYLEGKVQLDLIPIESITCRRIHIMHNGVSSVPYT